MSTFQRDGVTFAVPAGWAVDQDDTDDGGWAVTVSSGETAFAVVTLRPDGADADDLSEQTLEALKAEYKDIDALPAVDSLGGMPAVGYDLDFLTLDTPVTGWTRAVDTTAGPLLVLCQVSDYDRDENEPRLRALCRSIKVPDE